MTLANGAYEIINAANPSLALDVSNASDARGTNVQLYTRNQAAPQLAWVVVRSDGWATIHFPLIGKVLDNTGNSAAAGTNVEVWDDTGADAGLWRLDAVSGRTVTVDGKSYQAYRIRPKSNVSLSLDPQGDAKPKAQDNLWTYTDLTSYDSDVNALGQLWAFVPVTGVVRGGTYRLVSQNVIRLSNPGEGYAAGTALHMALDVADGMAEDGTNIQVWPAQGFGNQEWDFEPKSDGTVLITSAGLGKALDVYQAGGGSIWNGKNVQLYHVTGNSNQRWVVKIEGRAKLDGVWVPYVTIRTAAGSGTQYYLSSNGDRMTFDRNVMVWDGEGTPEGLHWFLIPTSRLTSSMPGASNVRGMDADGKVSARLGFAGDDTQVTPVWAGPPSTSWSVRYMLRWRTTKMARGARTSWGTWTSAADGSYAAAGLNDPTKANVATTDLSGGRVRMTDPITIHRGDGVDLVEVKIEVRSMSDDGREHGAPVSGTVTLEYAPKVTIGDVTWSPEGLRVPLSNGMPSGTNRWQVEAWSSGEMVGRDVLTQAANSLMATLDVLPFPADGDSLTIYAHCTTSGGMAASTNVAKTVALDSKGGGITISPKVTLMKGDLLNVSCSAPNMRCYVQAKGKTPVEVSKNLNRWDLPVPLGVPFTVWITARDGSKWDTWHKDYAARAGKYVWNFGDWWCAAASRLGEVPSVSATSDRTSNVIRIAGGGFERVHLGRGVGQQISAKVSMLPAVDGDDWEERLERMEREGGFCWFRDPRGHVVRAAITQVTRDSAVARGVDVTVDMRRVDVSQS